MTIAIAAESREIALELHALLNDIDPVRWKARMQAALRERLHSIGLRVQALLERTGAERSHPEAVSDPAAPSALRARLTELAELVGAHLPRVELPAADLRERWMSFRSRAQPLYEALAASLRVADVHVPSLRPTNYARNALHIGTGFAVTALIVALPHPLWLQVLSGACTVTVWFLEALRRVRPEANDRLMAALGVFAHPHEHFRVNSATWYTTALFGLSLTSQPMLCAVAVMTLGVGDPTAALVGRRWGRTKLINGRSLEGTLTFVGCATLAVTALLTLIYALPWTLAVPAALGAAVAGAVAELLSRRVDDNLTIPLCSAAGAWLTLLALV